MTQPTIGLVHLNVARLEPLIQFYTETIGLQVNRTQQNTIHLGVHGRDLLALTETPTAKRVSGTAGLYHFAILLPSRYDLAKSLVHLVQTRTPLQGLSDHGVSEAIYLEDPEGNGIEIYADRPHSQWYIGDRLQLYSRALDVDDLMLSLRGQETAFTMLHPDTYMGHIHLHVGHIQNTEAYYTQKLGVDVLVNYRGSATFMSYDGYHHHIGANIWAGRSPRHEGTLGLEKFELWVNPSRFDDLANRNGIQATDSFTLKDPSNNTIVVCRA
ncbi:MAG: VOC family protein [Phototrophicaceae bacterium]